MRLILFVMALLLGACTTRPVGEGVASKASSPTASRKPSEEDKQALRHLMDLSGWKQAPGILMKDCNKTDPEGASVRQSAYDRWMLERQQDWETLDRYEKQIIPKLLPTNGPADPIKGVQAMTLINVSRVFYTMDPKTKAKACAEFSAPSRVLNDPSWKMEAYAYLEKWVVAHQ